MTELWLKGLNSVVQPWCKKEKEKMQVFENQALAFCSVPGAGIEPARIAPLVFETSASTDSAIRAGGRIVLPIGSAKVLEFSEIAK